MNTSLPILPTSRASFEHIREEGLLYIDKTRQILTLLSKGDYLFLSRPRRFGKSLLVSTLDALFKNKKALFEGLYIYHKWEWAAYPVIWIDFSTMPFYKDMAFFENHFSHRLQFMASDYGISLPKADYLTQFSYLLHLLYKKMGKKVVVLIDEYDSPVTTYINDPQKANENRTLLQGFYRTLKAENYYIHKVFITGISKLAKMAVFSTMNNVYDVSLDADLNDIAGLTQQEVDSHFDVFFPVLEKKYAMTRTQIKKSIQEWYNGYSWNGKERLYNPYSILHLFNTAEFKNYWYQSGVPTLLVNMLVQKAFDENFKRQPDYYENLEAEESIFDTSELTNLSVEGILFQTGYLTIKKIRWEGFHKIYYLDYPNYEVKSSFTVNVLAKYAQMPKIEVYPGALKMKRALIEGNTERFVQLLKAYFAIIPYQLRQNQKTNEAFFHALFQMVFTLIGIEVIAERPLMHGRIDGVMELENRVYIIECKHSRKGTLKTLIKNALKQIEDKDYAAPYLSSGKTIFLMGIGFLEKNKDKQGRTKLEIDCKWKQLGTIG